MSLRIYAIRAFVRSGSLLGAQPPTIAVYEIDQAAGRETEAKPFAAFGLVPGRFRRIGRDELLAAAPNSAEMAEAS
jgi:hypothetical protein